MKIHELIAYPMFIDRWHWVVLEEVSDDDLECIYEQMQAEIIEEGDKKRMKRISFY